MSAIDLRPYRGAKRIKWRFWLRFVWQTFVRRRIEPLIAARLHGEAIAEISGIEYLPTGAMVLALNHYSGRSSYDVVAVVASVLSPEQRQSMTFVIGRRGRRLPPLILRPPLSVYEWILGRWSQNIHRISFRNAQPSLEGLRRWRRHDGVSFVFPEGRAGVCFRPVRDGVGLWLSTFAVPTVPVAVWWHVESGWHVRFGRPVRWSDRHELRDLQLGLNIADRLPSDLAVDWVEMLQRWRAAHQPEQMAINAAAYPNLRHRESQS